MHSKRITANLCGHAFGVAILDGRIIPWLAPWIILQRACNLSASIHSPAPDHYGGYFLARVPLRQGLIEELRAS